MTEILKVSLVQYNPVWEDVSVNLSRLSEMLKPLKGKTDLILLPEMFSTGFSVNIEKICSAENQEAVIKWMRLTAEATDAMIVGSAAIKEKSLYYNRMFWVSHDDSSEGYYDKNYLFIMSDEPRYFTAGAEGTQFELLGWKIKPIICYDLRFPELSRNNRVNPYDILLCVASWPAVRSDVWMTLLKARAIENMCYSIGVNRVGEDINQLKHKGDSVIYGPTGENIMLLPEDTETIVTTEISLSKLKRFRQRFPVLENIK